MRAKAKWKGISSMHNIFLLSFYNRGMRADPFEKVFYKTNLSKQTSLLIRTSCSYSQITHFVPQEIRSIVSI